MDAIRSARHSNPFRRDGQTFLGNVWTLVEAATPLQINEPSLIVLSDVEGLGDPRLKSIPVINAADFGLEEGGSLPIAATVTVNVAESDEFKKLKEEVEAKVTAAEGKLSKTQETIKSQGETISTLKREKKAVEIELAKANTELAKVTKERDALKPAE